MVPDEYLRLTIWDLYFPEGVMSFIRSLQDKSELAVHIERKVFSSDLKSFVLFPGKIKPL